MFSAESIVALSTHCLKNTLQTYPYFPAPALSGNMKSAVEINKDFIPWIDEQYKNGVETAKKPIGKQSKKP